MKKFRGMTALALAVMLTLGLLSGCSGDGNSKTGSAESVTSADSRTTEGFELTATELAKLMGNGINLGNTLEAYGHTSRGINASVSVYETLWGQPVTTQDMITGMKEAGFDTLRIPVAWTNTMDFENGDYTIREDFLARVKEVVDYAYNAGMYVIVNDHWDGGWWGMFGSATEETVQRAWDMYEAIWTQVGEYFKDYDYHLIFESANEELGARLNDNDSSFNSDSGTLSDNECYALCNEINQKFVDTIRSLGGNNAERFLLIAGANTNIANVLDSRFEMPEDTAEDKLLLSVHYYDPSNYTGAAGAASVSSWGYDTEVSYMNETLASLQKYTEQGIPVVIGEYGVLVDGQPASAEDLREGHLTYTKNLLANCEKYGLVPVLWDCNNVYDKSTCAIDCAELAAIYRDYSYAALYESIYTDEDIAKRLDQTINAIYNTAEVYGVVDGLAWIMYTAGDYQCSYAVGDSHPAGGSDGIVATEPVITGEGTYTVALDFTGTAGGYATGMAFAAIGIYNGESLFPGYIIEVQEIKVNGEAIEFDENSYTTTDDGTCTRLNLYNGWVTDWPKEGRSHGSVTDADMTGILRSDAIGTLKTIEVTFTYGL